MCGRTGMDTKAAREVLAPLGAAASSGAGGQQQQQYMLGGGGGAGGGAAAGAGAAPLQVEIAEPTLRAQMWKLVRTLATAGTTAVRPYIVALRQLCKE